MIGVGSGFSSLKQVAHDFVPKTKMKQAMEQVTCFELAAKHRFEDITVTNSPDDYRDPKITNAPAKKPATSYLPWLLLALGLLVLLAWLFGAFDGNDAVAPQTTAPATVTEQPATTPTGSDTAPTDGTAPAN